MKDIKDESYDGHPEFGVAVMLDAVSNSGMRAYHNVPNQVEGVLVRNVYPWSSLHGILENGDVIISIDDQKLEVMVKLLCMENESRLDMFGT